MEKEVTPSPIALGCDHAAVEFGHQLAVFLREKGYEVVEFPKEAAGGDDYPDIAAAVCKEVLSGECARGILVCGTGIGMSMAANRFSGIRAALCSDYYSVKYTRLHNNANVLCLGARVMGIELAKELLEVFLATGFEGGRHQRRIEKLDCIARG